MESSEPTAPTPSPDESARTRRRGSGLVAAAAAFVLTLAGLGVAAAQTGDSAPAAAEEDAPLWGDARLAAAQAEGDAPADGDGPPDGMVPHRGHGPGCGAGPRLDAAAEAIGVSTTELLDALRGGQSIAQVAQAKDVAVQDVINALVADAKEHLAERVTAGDLTQAQADEKITALTERITAMVNTTGLPGPGPGHRHHGPRPPAEAPAASSSATV